MRTAYGHEYTAIAREVAHAARWFPHGGTILIELYKDVSRHVAALQLNHYAMEMYQCDVVNITTGENEFPFETASTVRVRVHLRR